MEFNYSLSATIDKFNAIKQEAGATFGKAPVVGDEGHQDAQAFIAHAVGMDEEEARDVRKLAHLTFEQQMQAWGESGEVNIPTAMPGLWVDGFMMGMLYAKRLAAEGN